MPNGCQVHDVSKSAGMDRKAKPHGTGDLIDLLNIVINSCRNALSFEELPCFLFERLSWEEVVDDSDLVRSS